MKRLIPKKIQFRKEVGWIVDLIWGDRVADCFCIRHLRHWKERLIPKKIQFRKEVGWIVDLIWGDRVADCFCIRHLRHWKEGATFADGVCRDCLDKGGEEK